MYIYTYIYIQGYVSQETLDLQDQGRSFRQCLNSQHIFLIYIYNNYQYTYTRNEILSKYHDQKHVVCHSHIYIYIYVPDVHTHHLSRDTALASCSGVLGFGTFLALGSLFAFGFAFAFATPFSSAGVDPLDPETAPLESSMLVLNSLGIIAPASHLNSTCTHTTHIFIYLYTSVCVHVPTLPCPHILYHNRGT